MDERRLRVFLAIVDEGGVTRAAVRLGVAQPSLSQALRAIEHEYGVELFHRIGRGLRITPAGEALVGPARQALRSLEAAANAIDEVSRLGTGRLDIAALSTLASDPLADLIGRFRQSHQGISVRVHEAEGMAKLSALVRDGSCELGITHLPLAAGDLVALPLGQQDLLFVFPPDSPARNGPLPVTALANTPLVVSPPGTSTRMLLEQALADVGVEPLIAVETAAREATVPLVLAGAGAALLPRQTAADARRRGAIVRAPHPPITRQIGLVHREDQLSAAGRAFLETASTKTRRQQTGSSRRATDS